MPRLAFVSTDTSSPPDRLVADHRRAALARRVQAPPAVERLLAELCWPPSDRTPVAFRTMPGTMEAHAHG